MEWLVSRVWKPTKTKSCSLQRWRGSPVPRQRFVSEHIDYSGGEFHNSAVRARVLPSRVQHRGGADKRLWRCWLTEESAVNNKSAHSVFLSNTSVSANIYTRCRFTIIPQQHDQILDTYSDSCVCCLFPKPVTPSSPFGSPWAFSGVDDLGKDIVNSHRGFIHIHEGYIYLFPPNTPQWLGFTFKVQPKGRNTANLLNTNLW